MRTVMSNSMVAHVWAQQTQAHGKSSNGNFYFRDSTIYSYGGHFPIARMTKDARGRTCVLFTTRHYSMTTAQHKANVLAALRGLDIPVYYVERPDSTDQKDALKAYVKEFEERAASFAKPHVHTWRSIEGRLDDIESEAESVRAFAHAFKLTCPSLDVPGKRKAIRDAFERYNSPEAKAKREKAAEKRVIKNAKVIGIYHAWIEGVAPLEHVTTLGLDQYQKRQVERARNAAKHGPEPRRITAEEWIEGKGPAAASPCWLWDETLIRRKGDVLETSRGADVPFAHAVAVFRLAQSCRQLGKSWHTNGHKIRIGHFELTSIDQEGNIRAGCHIILWEEMLRLALREVPQLVQPIFPLPVPLAA